MITTFNHFCDPFIALLKTYVNDPDSLLLFDRITEILQSKIRNGNLVAVMGNGGSMADASHFSAELTVRYQINRSAFRSIALASDTTFLTACANDFGYDDVFKRSIESLCTAEDLVIGITTSGKSTNVLHGLEYAREIGCETIAMCGSDTLLLDNICDVVLSFPSDNTSHIQSFHRLFYHWLVESLESSL